MADHTAIPEIVDALLAEFTTAVSGLAAPEVIVSHQWDRGSALDQLAVQRVKAEREFKAMGAVPVPTAEMVNVTCFAGAVRGEKSDAHDRMWAILDAAWGQIRNNPTLGVDAVQWARVSELTDSGIARTDNNPAAEALFVVQVKVRIYP